MAEFVGENTRVVAFDFDDTLVGTHTAIWALHKHIAENYYSLSLTDAEIAFYWGQPVATLAKQYYRTDDVDTGVALMLKHQTDFPKATFEHTVPALRHLKATGKILGIVSATTRPILELDAERAAIPLEVFDFIQTSEDTTVHKPYPEIFDPLISFAQQQGIEKDEILYIGDGLHDMAAAVGAGIKFLGVRTGLVDANTFAKHGADNIPDLSDLTK